MYAQLPDNLAQSQLLQLLTLAESYKIDKVSSAVVSSINGIQSEKLEWETVLAVLQLPCHEPLYQSAKTVVKRRMMQLLGDLDIVWALEQPEQRAQLQRTMSPKAAKTAIAASTHIKLHDLLLQLPFEQLLVLLQEPQLRCTEDTLHYTVTRWSDERRGLSCSQQKQLAALLQLDRCSPTYLLSLVLRPESWTSKSLSPAAAACWTALSISKQHGIDSLQELAHERLRLDAYCPSSRRCKRNPSRLSTLTLDWAVPLVDIRAAYAQCLAAEVEEPLSILQKGKSFFQGREFQLQLNILARAEAHDEELHGTLRYLQVAATAGLHDAHYHCSYKVRTGLNTPEFSLALDTTYGGMNAPFEKAGLLLLCEEDTFFVLADVVRQAPPLIEYPMHDWAEIEDELRGLQLVADDHHIHVTATISHVQ